MTMILGITIIGLCSAAWMILSAIAIDNLMRRVSELEQKSGAGSQ